MTFEEYLLFTDDCHFFHEGGITYLALGLAGESGEVVDEIKKLWRDDKGILTTERRQKLLLEMGDVLYYLTRIGKELGVTLGEIADLNKTKLVERQATGKVIG